MSTDRHHGRAEEQNALAQSLIAMAIFAGAVIAIWLIIIGMAFIVGGETAAVVVFWTGLMLLFAALCATGGKTMYAQGASDTIDLLIENMRADDAGEVGRMQAVAGMFKTIGEQQRSEREAMRTAHEYRVMENERHMIEAQRDAGDIFAVPQLEDDYSEDEL